MDLVTLSAYDMKNNCSLFDRLFIAIFIAIFFFVIKFEFLSRSYGIIYRCNMYIPVRAN